MTGIFGDEEDERFRKARIALKKLALLERRVKLLAEETCTVNYWYDSQQEALEDITQKRREQYEALSPAKKREIGRLINEWARSEAIVLSENAVFSFFTKG